MNTFSIWQEGVESQDELVVAAEEVLDALDHTRRVNPVRGRGMGMMGIEV